MPTVQTSNSCTKCLNRQGIIRDLTSDCSKVCLFVCFVCFFGRGAALMAVWSKALPRHLREHILKQDLSCFTLRNNEY